MGNDKSVIPSWLRYRHPDATVVTWRELPGGGWAHKTASIGERASIGADVSIGERASIGADVSIGERASIGEGASIGADVSIGERASIGADVSIGERASIGADVSIGEGASIGADVSIGEGASIGADVSIGEGASIGADVSIGERASIGEQYDYIVLPGMGSRNAPLCVYRDKTHGIAVSTGCFYGSAESFLNAVNEKYPTGTHGDAYRHAMTFALAVVRRHDTSQDKTA